MKASELRIGNLLQRLDGSIFSVIANDIKIISEWASYKELLPKSISLTEEWLLKFGAKKEYDCIIYDRFKLIYKEKYKYCYVVNLEFGDGYLTKFEYVHEWQNFIFIMNGEELTLKQ